MTSLLAKVIRFIAVFVLASEIPVPIYWLLLHAPVSFWRKHRSAAFPVAVLAAWGIGDLLLFHFHKRLFRASGTAMPALAGLALIAFDLFAFSTSEAVLGGRRIVGHSELAGSCELIVRGLYGWVRHPRYLGMMAGVLGACLIVAAPALWAASIGWLLLALVSIRAEERELHTRLGPAYGAYSERVPALLPFRLSPRNRQSARRDRP